MRVCAASLIVLDEVFGFLPPHPANPATKPPLVALMEQARALRPRRGSALVAQTEG